MDVRVTAAAYSASVALRCSFDPHPNALPSLISHPNSGAAAVRRRPPALVRCGHGHGHGGRGHGRWCSSRWHHRRHGNGYSREVGAAVGIASGVDFGAGSGIRRRGRLVADRGELLPARASSSGGDFAHGARPAVAVGADAGGGGGDSGVREEAEGMLQQQRHAHRQQAASQSSDQQATDDMQISTHGSGGFSRDGSSNSRSSSSSSRSSGGSSSSNGSSGPPYPHLHLPMPRRLLLACTTAVPLALAVGGAALADPSPELIVRPEVGEGLRRGAAGVGGWGNGAWRAVVQSLEGRVSTFTLRNGMRWVVVERHTAPIAAFHTYADVGASDEQDGSTGIAHLLEHLAFKGTALVGTQDAAAEAVALDQLDEAFYELREARDVSAPKSRIAQLEKQFLEAKQRADAYAVPNEYGSILSREGALGLNAVTSQDSTQYYVSLPVNKMELWMALESARFISPVFRQLYSEKEVVKEERRLRVDNSPYGTVSEQFAALAFPGRPYGRPPIGYMADLDRIGRREVESFFRRHYTPSSLICAVVGDVDPHEVERLATKYFGGWEAAAGAVAAVQWLPAWRTTDGWQADAESAEGSSSSNSSNRVCLEPSALTAALAVASEEKRVRLSANPLYLEGYLRPNAASVDDPAMSVVSALLSGSRSSRFYKNLILKGQALSAAATESFPGDKYSTLFLISAFPPSGATTDDVAAALHRELEMLAISGATQDELARIANSTQVSFMELLGSNSGMAAAMCEYTVRAGTWRAMVDEQVSIAAVTSDDVRRVACRLFGQSRRVAVHATPSA